MPEDELLARYTPKERELIRLFLNKLAKATRKAGKISEPRKEKIIASFAAYDTDVVAASLTAYMNMAVGAGKGGKGKNEKYVLGIMANKQKAKDGKAGGNAKLWGRAGGKGEADKGCADEGERLQRLIGERLATGTDAERLECDF